VVLGGGYRGISISQIQQRMLFGELRRCDLNVVSSELVLGACVQQDDIIEIASTSIEILF